MAWLRELTRGFDRRRLALTFGVALVVAGALCVPAMSVSPFPRYLVGSLAFAFGIALALTVSGNLRQSLVPPPVLQALAVLVAIGVVTLLLYASMAPSLGQHRLGAVLTLGGVVATVMAFVMALRQRQAADGARHEARERLLEKQVMEARLKLLQAQVEPHFLFNTLASVQRLLATDVAAASAMLEDLSQYLRASLPDMRESQSTVGREIDMARAYLNIMQVRMGKRLSFAIDLPEALREAAFPPTMLMSLVENAVEHGLGDAAHGRIQLRASSGPGWLAVQVADDGQGIDTHAAAGVGLSNIRARLGALYGPDASLALEQPAEASGLMATIRVPMAA